MRKRLIVTQQLTRIAVLSALCVALRYAFGAFPNIKPITAIFLLLTVELGLLEGSLIMILTMTVTAFTLGFGPWVLWQILAYLLILFCWRMIIHPLTALIVAPIAKRSIQSLCAGVMGILYGLVVDGLSAVFYHLSIWAIFLNGLGFSLAHALSTAIFYPLLAPLFARLRLNQERKINEKVSL